MELEMKANVTWKPPFEQLDFGLEEFFFGDPPTWAL
jgi:hypothetical protein